MLMRVLMRMRMKCRSQSITATSWWYGIFLFFTAKLFALRDGRIRFHIYFTPLFIREKVYQLRGAAPSHSTTQQQGSKQASKQASKQPWLPSFPLRCFSVSFSCHSISISIKDKISKTTSRCHRLCVRGCVRRRVGKLLRGLPLTVALSPGHHTL